MHGRLKLPTSEEQQIQKQKERDLKLKAFVSVRDKIWRKRQSGELDEELLSLTGKIILKNPDVYSLWNVRREVLLKLETSEIGETREKRLGAELELIDGCLLNNHKSYGAWHQRSWVISRQSKPNFTREVEVCDLALLADERNFHCWDYRRFICCAAKIPVEKELDFSDGKLIENFSNYSAWHYRSSLMPTVFRDPTGRLALEQSKLESEINFVQNAFFTDPEDSSAWIYHYWLLSNKTDSASDQVKLTQMSVSLEGRFCALVFSKPIRLSSSNYQVRLTVTNEQTDTNLECCSVDSPDGSRSSLLWILRSDKLRMSESAQSVRVRVSSDDSTGNWSLSVDCSVEPAELFGVTARTVEPDSVSLPPEIVSVLETEVASCTQLVELEPNNKWPLLNLFLVQRAVGKGVTSDEMSTLLEQLKTADSKRTRFYDDLRSRCLIEDTLNNPCVQRSLSLCKLNLTRLMVPTGLMTFVRKLDVSDNQLSSVAHLIYMPNLEVVNADGNQIGTLEGLQRLLVLKEVSVRHNRIDSVAKVEVLAGTSTLMRLCLAGNPISQSEEERGRLQQLFGSVVTL